jgi:peptide/nickel transport system substrate-binding protein
MRFARRRRVCGALLAICGSLLVVSGSSASGTKGAFIVALPGTPVSMDYAAYAGQPTSDVEPMMGSFLFRFKPSSDPETIRGAFGVVGDLAQSWKFDSKGNLIVTLRHAVSNWGNPLTANDVKWSMQRNIAIGVLGKTYAGAAQIDMTNPVTVVNKSTVQVNVVGASPLILGVLCHYTWGILDSTEALKHATPDDPWARTWLASNTSAFGPYYVSGFVPGQEVFLQRNPHYFDKVDISKVVVKTIPDPSVRLQLALSGDVDFTSGLTFDQYKSALGNKNVHVFNGAGTLFDVLIPNLNFKPFADPKVRQAISMAIDRNALISSVYSGFGKPALYQVPSSYIGVHPYPVPGVKYDPAAAKTLLAQAGYPAGFTVTMTVCPCRPGAYIQPAAELIQSQLAQIGVTVNLNVLSSAAQFTAAWSSKTSDLVIVNAGAGIPDASYYGLNFYTPSGSQDWSNYNDTKLNTLVPLGNSTLPGKRRNRIFVSIAKTLEANPPVIPLVETRNVRLWSTKISGQLSGALNAGSNGVFVDRISKAK